MILRVEPLALKFRGEIIRERSPHLRHARGDAATIDEDSRDGHRHAMDGTSEGLCPSLYSGMMVTGGLIGTLILALDIVAIYSVLTSAGSLLRKTFWIFLILILPLVGMILWFLIGRK